MLLSDVIVSLPLVGRGEMIYGLLGEAASLDGLSARLCERQDHHLSRVVALELQWPSVSSVSMASESEAGNSTCHGTDGQSRVPQRDRSHRPSTTRTEPGSRRSYT